MTLLTDGGRSQNGRGRWNHRKDKMAYASTRRNGADRDVWLIDPKQGRSSEKLVMENQGGGWAPLDWSPDDSQLLVAESLSVNKSNLYLLELSSGKRRLLTPGDELISFNGGRFDKAGKGIYFTCDKEAEFQRLSYMDLASGVIEPLVSDIKWDVDSFELSPNGDTILFDVNEAGVSISSSTMWPKEHTVL